MTPAPMTPLRVVVHDFSGHPGQVHLSRELARRGHRVEHQFCSSYTTGRGATQRRDDDPEGFTVHELRLAGDFHRYRPGSRIRQELDYARLAGRAIRAARPDAVIVSNIPLLAMVLLSLTLRRHRIPYLLWWQDVYSDAIATVARHRLPVLGRLVGWIARRCERRVAARAAGIVAIADSFLAQLDSWKIPRERAQVIPNWAAIDEMPTRPRDNDWSRAHGLGEDPVVMYSGTLGLKHNPAVISELARQAPAPPGTRFVVVSEGRGREWLETEAADTPGLLLLDYQPYPQLPEMLASADVLLVVLERDASRYSVPSKVLNYLCAGRAVLALLPTDNAVAQMLREAGAGVVVEPSDAATAATALGELLSDPARRERMGRAGRSYAERTFDVRRIGDRFESILASVTAPSTPTSSTASSSPKRNIHDH